MPEEFPDFNPPEGPHPFQGVLDQISALLLFMEQHKHKSIGAIPNHLLGQLEQLETDFAKFRKLAEKNLPPVEADEVKLKEIMNNLPPQYRQYIAKMIVQARGLKKRSEELKENWLLHQESKNTPYIAEEDDEEFSGKPKKDRPLELLSKEHESESETQKSGIQHRKRFGRMGGRKNWKPL